MLQTLRWDKLEEPEGIMGISDDTLSEHYIYSVHLLQRDAFARSIVYSKLAILSRKLNKNNV